MKNLYFNTQSRITSHLLINGKCIRSKELSTGIPGIALYFYMLPKIKGKHEFHKIADEYFDSIENLSYLTCDYFTGLGGICYLVEFLSKYGYLDMNTNDVVEEMDNNFFYEAACVDKNNIEYLWSIGKILMARYESKWTKNKGVYAEFLIHISDKIISYYSDKLLTPYDFKIQDIRLMNILCFCMKEKINLQIVSLFLVQIKVIIGEIPVIKSNLINQNLRAILSLPLTKKLKYHNDTSEPFEIISQLFLLLNIYKTTGEQHYRRKAKNILNSYLSHCNDQDLNKLTGLHKSTMKNYGIKGFCGWGIILIAAQGNFHNNDWIELYL